MSAKHLLLSVFLIGCLGSLIAIVVKTMLTSEERETPALDKLSSDEWSSPVMNEPIQPLEAPANLDAQRVAIGEMLFHDPRLSTDNSISCASCHNLQTGGVDRLARSIGIKAQVGVINSPTVFNSGLNIAQFWDGRADTLEEQIDGPTHNPIEMGSTWVEIVDKIKADTSYKALFETNYIDGITEETVKDAIASFERSLVSLDAPFDRYLRGDADAISEDAKAGYKTFKELGCISCHQGNNVGGNLFQKFGVMGDYFGDRNTPITQSDLGRYNVTGLEADRFVFRVPSLRLASLTPPYFHDGSVATLQEAVRVMIKYQLGRLVTEKDEQLIVEFIHSPVGKYNGEQL